MLREFLVPFVEHYSALGWQVDGMVGESTTAADIGDELEAFGKIHVVGFSRSPFAARNLIAAPRRIRAVVAREAYDIVHVHTPVASFATRYALRNRGSRPAVIYTAHGFHFHRGGSPLKNGIYQTIERAAGPWTDYLVVINREDEAAAINRRIVPRDRLIYMPGIGVDVKAYSPERVTTAEVERVRDELELAPSDHLILMIAEFNPGKRHRDALNAFSRLNRPNAQLAFAGVGPLAEEVRALANRLGVAERVKFLGYRRDIPVLLKAASALLLPSEREGLPRSILEALCMGTPVIASQIRGVEDLLSGERGLMHPVGDIGGLLAALERLLDNSQGAASMAKRGQEHVQTLDHANIIRLHDELYARALSR